MRFKSLGNPFDGDVSLVHGNRCDCHQCARQQVAGMKQASQLLAERETDKVLPADSEAVFDRAIESAVVRSVFGHSEHSRRSFMKLMGGGAAAALLASVFPMAQAKAAIKESLGKLEKTRLTIGFVPITCATPIIMAHPMGFYERYGLDVEIIKTAGLGRNKGQVLVP